MCPTCSGHGRLRSDEELDRELLANIERTMNCGIGSDPDMGSTAGIARKMDETEDRIVAAMDRLAKIRGWNVTPREPK